ncbi:hypothetical protein [Spirosoma fluviale]|uniref:Chromosome partition protein Smc n=1 Tax=Spirosoma fluviale TaxID=1597977 RepID=A0A286FCS1_9BACT|nr:hypothetical protein [Spirosoma fluviale]SOD81028.1 hypothetical protein SAMN06269250_1650 [Spirosoma fluviale]
MPSLLSGLLPRVLLLVAIVGGLVWLVVDYLGRGTTITELTATLFDTRDSLRVERRHRRQLQVDSTILENQFLKADNERLSLRTQMAEAQTSVEQMQAGLQKANDRSDRAVDQMSALEKKHAADIGVLATKVALGLPTTERDTAVNAIIAKQSRKIKRYEDTVIADLNRANAYLKVDNDRLKGEVSDLETELNGAVRSSLQAEDSWLKESQTHRFGDLRGKARRKNAMEKADAVRLIREGKSVTP